ncbi:MAG: ABC transporter ATP-binding protein [Faecalibacterium sp.]
MEHLLEVKNLETTFTSDFGASAAVDRISYYVNPGETVCLVGESGCGKSVSSLSLLRLLARNGAVTGGEVLFEGVDLLTLSDKALDKIRGSCLSMIFQDALSSLNPVFTIGNQIVESIRAHTDLTRKEAEARAADLLEKVGVADPVATLKKYPHTLSGGQRQRVMIALALACSPKLLIADEPTTALDVTIQAQIMQLLKELQAENGMSIQLITHDIGLVAQMADRVLVMYAGQIVEQGEVRDVFKAPAHPYTRALLASVPDLPDNGGRRLVSIQGSVPEHYQFITGCRFASRCPHAAEFCAQPQGMVPLGNGHAARCYLAMPNAKAEGEV